MAIAVYAPRAEYVGTGIVLDYTFDFKIASLEHLIVQVISDTFVETFRVRGSDTTYLTGVVFNAEEGGGTVSLVTALPNNHLLTILLANDAPLQESEFKNKSDFTLKRFEAALDVLGGAVQRLTYLVGRSFKLSDNLTDAEPFDTALDINSTTVLTENNVGKALIIGPDNASIVLGASTAAAVAAVGVLPGGATGAVLAKLSPTDNDTEWHQYAYSGYSSRFASAFSSTDLADTLAQIIAVSYSAPTISFSASGSGTVREKGTSVASTLLTANVTKLSDPIAEVRFYQGVTLVDTKTGTIPAGGSETYTYAVAFTDTISFSAKVDDDGSTGGPTTVTSNTVTFSYVYPYYSGAGAVGLSAAAVGALTKGVQTTSASVAKSFTATVGQVFYFAQPAGYTALTSILDVSNFETFADWTVTVANITGLDATAQSYRIYEFNNPVAAGTYTYTFKR